MQLELIIYSVLTLPLLYLLHWGLTNSKLAQYWHYWLSMRHRLTHKRKDLLMSIKKGEGENIHNERRNRYNRRNSIDKLL